VRTVTTVLSWLVATVALIVAVPAVWTQLHLVDVDGFTDVAQSAAKKPALQKAMASELTSAVVNAAGDRGIRPPAGIVRDVATTYTESPSFPGQFAQVNRVAHRWLFTDAARQTGNKWEIDVAPMLADTTFHQTLDQYDVTLPATVTVPVVGDGNLQPGRLRWLATWGPWVSMLAVAFAGVAALITVAAARNRGRALAAVGVSALIAAGVGWALAEAGRGAVTAALTGTSDNVRTIADAMVDQGINSLHLWLGLTLLVGLILVAVGFAPTVLGTRRRPPPPSATETQMPARF
jgi:hypothetical protein